MILFDFVYADLYNELYIGPSVNSYYKFYAIINKLEKVP